MVHNLHLGRLPREMLLQEIPNHRILIVSYQPNRAQERRETKQRCDAILYLTDTCITDISADIIVAALVFFPVHGPLGLMRRIIAVHPCNDGIDRVFCINHVLQSISNI